MRDRIAGLFGQRRDDQPEAAIDGDVLPATDAMANASEVSEETTPLTAVAPPEDFKFPWTRPQVPQETFASVDEALPKGETSAEAEEPLSVEAYKDRIDAAADAIDVASDKTFTPGRD